MLSYVPPRNPQDPSQAQVNHTIVTTSLFRLHHLLEAIAVAVAVIVLCSAEDEELVTVTVV